MKKRKQTEENLKFILNVLVDFSKKSKSDQVKCINELRKELKKYE